MKLSRLILASASPRRSELLRGLGLRFAVVASDAGELESEHLTARELSLVNAHRKARAVAKRYPDATVLGADTVVSTESRIYGKPRDREEAFGMLTALQGRTHQVITGVCLVHLREHRERLFAEITEVRFRGLDDAAIRRYLEQVNPLDKAGGYAIQEHGDWIIEEISGSFTNVIGLPIERLRAEIEPWEEAGEGTIPQEGVNR
jgi:septum formation protein